MRTSRKIEGDWHPGVVPENVFVHETAHLETTYSFLLFRSQRERAIEIGRGSSVYLGVMFDLGPEARVTLGKFVLMNGARIVCDLEITIGDYSLISWNVVLMDTYRVPVAPARRAQQLKECLPGSSLGLEADSPARPIRIGRNVWIGFDSCVLPGVTIGDHAVVGARSVVTQDVPAHTLVAGNPARVIRHLKPPDPTLLAAGPGLDRKSS